MKVNLPELKAERTHWETSRFALLRADSIDPDMLDERARTWSGYADPRDDPPALRPR